MDPKLWAGFVTIMAAIIFLAYQTHTHNQRQLLTNQWVTHTNQVLYSSQRLLTVIVSAETGYRGFVITGNEVFLNQVVGIQDSIRKEFSRLKGLTADNTAQAQRIATLETAIKKKIAWDNAVVSARKRNQSSAIALVSSLEGKENMDKIRDTLAAFQTAERVLLHQRTVDNSQQITSFNRIYVLEQVVLGSLVLTLSIMIMVNLNARRKAEIQLREAAGEIRDLYDQAPSGYYSVNGNRLICNMNKTLLDWLGYRHDEVVGVMHYEDILSEECRRIFLENYEKDFDKYTKSGSASDFEFEFRRKNGSSFPVLVNSKALKNEKGEFLRSRSSVIDYTSQKSSLEKILALNGELEAFTYSVSHDLRAPLRSITGYTQILQEDYGATLDEEGRRLTSVIANNALRMGQLIDDLLEFSRVGRKELIRVNINTSELVNTVLKDFDGQLLQGKWKVHVGKLNSCSADLSMLRQVWINLISNALKYSSKKDSPEVNISSCHSNGVIQFCVEDNGVGFDMKYADKLFNVFQRLHKMNEFEGTGVGLALVKRIIEKHNGKVWVESNLNNGARFYFSIPSQ